MFRLILFIKFWDKLKGEKNLKLVLEVVKKIE